jgi:hypothetical protein
LLGAFFSLVFLFANKVSSTVCNVSNIVLTPQLHKYGCCPFNARKGLLIWREWSIAEFPMMSFLSISFSASAARRAFFSTGAYNKMSSSETESTPAASDMSDMSYEQ